MRTFGSAMATLSVGVLAAGLLWPHLALTFLQSLLAVLALGYLGARIHQSHLPAALSSDKYSPFEGPARRPPSATSPPAVRRLTMLLQAAADPEEARRAPMPVEAVRILAAETSRRLAERHGLSPSRPGDQDRIRSLVSDATWTLIEATRDEGRVPLGVGSMDLLEDVLDDVEQL